jgi:uncharacterized protein DUF3473
VPPVLYCHPWELDHAHPPMRLSPLGALVHFGGRRRTAPRLARLLSRYRLRTMESLLAAAAPRAEDAPAPKTTAAA